MPLRRAMIAFLALLACVDCSEPKQDSHSIMSLSPLGTRAVIAMGLAKRMAIADPASRALLPAPDDLSTDPRAVRIQLALVPPRLEPLAPELEALLARAERIVVVDPHDLDEARALYEEIGDALDPRAKSDAIQRRIADLLGEFGARSTSRDRPCVVTIVGLAPFALAGGHSFESNVLEILGAESATHDQTATHRVEADRDTVRSFAPDLVLVTADDVSPRALEALARELAPLDVVPAFFDPEPIWLADQAAARPQLEHWSRLVERARANVGGGTNCRRSAPDASVP